MKNAIELKNISKSYQDFKLDNINNYIWYSYIVKKNIFNLKY